MAAARETGQALAASYAISPLSKGFLGCAYCPDGDTILLESMNDVAPNETAWSTRRYGLNIVAMAAQVADILFYATAVSIVLNCTLDVSILGEGHRLEGFFVLTAAASIILSTSRAIPFQNAVLAAIIIGSVGTFVHTTLSFLFDSCAYSNVGRPMFMDILPWHIPLCWIVTILASRGTAQQILSERRNTSRYGFEMMACTTILSLILLVGMQPFCEWINGFSFRLFRFAPLMWFGVPVSTFLAWMVVTLVALLLATPVLIDKRPGHRPPGFRPLCLWCTLTIVFAAASMRLYLWPEGALMSAATVAVPALAMYKRSRSEPQHS